MTNPQLTATFQEFNPDSKPSRIETEISLAWAKENPDLFFKAVADFRDLTTGWGQKIDTTREGFITLAASRQPVEDGTDFTITQVKNAAQAYLLGPNNESRKRNLTVILQDMGHAKVADVFTRDQRVRLMDLFT